MEKDQEVIWAKPGMPWESFSILWAFLPITFIFPFIHVTEHMTVNCFSLVVGKNIVEETWESLSTKKSQEPLVSYIILCECLRQFLKDS